MLKLLRNIISFKNFEYIDEIILYNVIKTQNMNLAWVLVLKTFCNA